MAGFGNYFVNNSMEDNYLFLMSQRLTWALTGLYHFIHIRVEGIRCNYSVCLQTNNKFHKLFHKLCCHDSACNTTVRCPSEHASSQNTPVCCF